MFFLDTYQFAVPQQDAAGQAQPQRLTPDDCVYVLDRAASEPSSGRCDASHRRQIDPQTVKQERTPAAGFVLQSEGQRPAADRFLLVFGKAKTP